ncbi:MAG: hypothetical protein Q3983_02360 [Capnocytophaga sp.]|nr:hypothetical protein [Capnocytophaga sp.]
MKTIYIFLMALILAVIAFFLAISTTESTGAALFLLGMLPVAFVVIIVYTKLLEVAHIKSFISVALCTFIACYAMVFLTAFLLESDSRWGVWYAFWDVLRLMIDPYLLICNIAITLIYSALFVFFKLVSRKKEN